MQASTSRLQQISPVSKQIRSALAAYTIDLQMGRIANRINQRLLKGTNDKKVIDLSLLKGLEFQDQYPFDQLFTGSYALKMDIDNGLLHIDIIIPAGGAVKRFNKLVSSYRFTMILLISKGKKQQAFQAQSTVSAFYFFDNAKTNCSLDLSIPPKNSSWLLCLKVECFEGNEPGKHPKMRTMKVIEGSGG